MPNNLDIGLNSPRGRSEIFTHSITEKQLKYKLQHRVQALMSVGNESHPHTQTVLWEQNLAAMTTKTQALAT